jgi:hypothetical protein
VEHDKINVSNRLNELGSSQTTQYLSWVIDAIIAILGLFVVYKLYAKLFGQVSMSPSIPDLTST